MKCRHEMPFGAEARSDGTTRFRFWAPASKRVHLELDKARSTTKHAMSALADGWHEFVARDAPPGTPYRYVPEGATAVPDPASRYNRQGVHGPSEVIDPLAFPWLNGDWQGRPWEEAVIYEMHIGTFTPEGTFTAATALLPELAALGITAIELMPVASFPGDRNWGYDGVLLFAPHAGYGTPADMKGFVDAAHRAGMMVFLDVVYNHFGPEGNYLHGYCPQFFNPAHQTPWGAAINFDGPHSGEVRDFFVHNALYWIEEYFLDGLRLDAVHAIRDDSEPDIVCAIARALREGPGSSRHVHLIVENEDNGAAYLERDEAHSPRFASAQWNDDIHHALHVLVTGENDGYYADYADQPLQRLGRGLAEGFVYQDDPSAFRNGERRGSPSAQLPPAAFVNFLQTHDQVGNRAMGERIGALAGDPKRLRTALACLLLSPQPPMLFMGEEFNASSPFLYFCDFGPELAEAVSRGRREEFARFSAFSDPIARESIPDPGDRETFTRSKLRWEERLAPGQREHLELTRTLLELRRDHIAPHLAGTGGHCGQHEIVDGALRVTWALGDGARLHLAANFGDAEAFLSGAPAGTSIYEDKTATDGSGTRLAPGGVSVRLEPA
ncbi:MAG: malto-oligosyltrehalose trehalohydrolase [Betaproteobacteria bacterium]|nr:malto-oligosyltrehalose trehalohydrolase [Betaproteobacteria bacterium]